MTLFKLWIFKFEICVLKIDQLIPPISLYYLIKDRGPWQKSAKGQDPIFEVEGVAWV
jgi:hypothetical protein